MNDQIRKINPESLIFFDIETASQVPILEENTEMFKVFRHKSRNKETEELLSVEDTQALYNKIAALSSSFGKVVCFSMGRIKDNKISLFSIKGEEKDILNQAYTIIGSSSMACVSFNGQGFDIPFCRQRAAIYDLVAPKVLNDVGLKPWSFDDIGNIDCLKVMQGTSPFRMAFSELCLMLGVESPKNGSIEGSGVSKAYHEGRIDEIVEYCEKDVRALINVFLRMQGKPIIE